MINKKVAMEKIIVKALSSENALSLVNLRNAFRRIKFAKEEKNIAFNLLAEAHMACFNLDAENAIYAIQYFQKAKNYNALIELFRLVKLYKNIPAVKMLMKIGEKEDVSDLIFSEYDMWEVSILAKRKIKLLQPNIDNLFREYCKKNGIKILRKIQSGVNEIRRSSFVYLVFDSDGIVKIFKEMIDYKQSRLGKFFNNEDEIYEELSDRGYAHGYYGKVDIGQGIIFLKTAYKFGQPLSEKITKGDCVSFDEASAQILKIAEKIKEMHEACILYHDLKPEHCICGEDEIELIDFGVSRITDGNKADVYLASPRYGSPEEGRCLRASYASDVFQLGMIFYELLTGEHPFMVNPNIQETDNRESEILKYFWPIVSLSFEEKKLNANSDKRIMLIARMLAKNPKERPTIYEIIQTLKTDSSLTKSKPSTRKIVCEKKINSLLFPARMGIPHRGHIEYISRLINIGYHVAISIQRSYTLTDRDPIPKWLVAKMVAQSLFDKGFTLNHFSIFLTPFYRTADEMKMHFAMMPGMSDVIGIASSNPGIRKIFPESDVFNQKTVFGKEGEGYEDLSWGEILRSSVKHSDYQIFLKYAASGVLKILSFSELQNAYAKPVVEFVKGVVRVCLVENKRELARTRIFRYLNPVECLIIQLRQTGNQADVLDHYSRDTVVLLNNKKYFFIYQYIEICGDDEIIFYECKPVDN